MKDYLFVLLLFCFNIGYAQSEEAFTLVLLPDTQTYAEKYPEIFEVQTEWIAEHADQFTFVLHQGDITQSNNQQEWEIAQQHMRMLDGKVPYTVLPGNHDMGSEPGKFADVRNTDLMNRFFPLRHYKKASTFGGAFEEGKIDNTYHLFSAGGYDWLILSLEFGPRNEVLDWANEVITQHPQRKVIINTHSYMYSDNTRQGEGDWWRPQDYGIGKNTGQQAPNDGEQIWEKLASRHANIMFVFSGHILHDGQGTLVSEGEHGNKVYQMLANYQGGVRCSENGGNGFLRLITVDPQQRQITVDTYSPFLDEHYLDPEHQFMFQEVIF